MNEENGSIEIRKYVNPFDELKQNYAASEEGLDILEQAEALSKGLDSGGNLNTLPNIRESIRRDSEFNKTTILQLIEIASKIGEESYQDQYIIMELVQAAAVASCSINTRNHASFFLARASQGMEIDGNNRDSWNNSINKSEQESAHGIKITISPARGRPYPIGFAIERVRQAYNDLIEGHQILMRFFHGDKKQLLKSEQSLRSEWHAIMEQEGSALDIFDPVSEDPVGEWMELLLWNSDHGQGSGLLAQIDPMLRLALRWEHWLTNKALSLESLIPRMVQQCDKFESEDDSWLALRCLITIGDALAEVKQWELAANVYSHLLNYTSYSTHPIYFHAISQCAYSYMMMGNLDECQR